MSETPKSADYVTREVVTKAFPRINKKILYGDKIRKIPSNPRPGEHLRFCMPDVEEAVRFYRDDFPDEIELGKLGSFVSVVFAAKVSGLPQPVIVRMARKPHAALKSKLLEIVKFRQWEGRQHFEFLRRDDFEKIRLYATQKAEGIIPGQKKGKFYFNFKASQRAHDWFKPSFRSFYKKIFKTIPDPDNRHIVLWLKDDLVEREAARKPWSDEIDDPKLGRMLEISRWAKEVGEDIQKVKGWMKRRLCPLLKTLGGKNLSFDGTPILMKATDKHRAGRVYQRVFLPFRWAELIRKVKEHREEQGALADQMSVDEKTEFLTATEMSKKFPAWRPRFWSKYAKIPHPFFKRVLAHEDADPHSPIKRQRFMRFAVKDGQSLEDRRDYMSRLSSGKRLSPDEQKVLDQQKVLNQIEAEVVFGFDRATLGSYWREESCQYLQAVSGKRVKLWSEMRFDIATDGRVCLMRHYRRSELSTVEKQIASIVSTGEIVDDEKEKWIVQKTASKRYGLAVVGLTNCRNKPWYQPKARGHVLGAKKFPIVRARNSHGPDLWVYNDFDCRVIRARLDGQPDPERAISAPVPARVANTAGRACTMEESRRRIAILNKWDARRQAGVPMKDFCTDEGFKVETLRGYQSWKITFDKRVLAKSKTIGLANKPPSKGNIQKNIS